MGQKTTSEWVYVSTLRKHVVKEATIKGKNMLAVGSIFFPLKVAPMRIENKSKGH